MHSGSKRRCAAAAALVVAVAPASIGAGAAAALPPVDTAFTTTTLHFLVHTGAADGTGATACDIVGDLYRPATATAATPAPAILTTNGFGGSKNDQAGFATAYAAKGYVVLSYSGLGFGGSGCKITLDDREHDGTAGSQLVDFLGGKGGQAFTDATHLVAFPAPDYVVRDDLAGPPRPASDGTVRANDPRVGMIGGSYGGQVQFAVAAVDPRVDTIVPIITWNDLAYSLAPNDTSLPSGSVTYATPGTEKIDWTSLFFGVGIADGIQGATADPTRNVGCPNFADEACVAKAQLDAAGFPIQSTIDFARNASVSSYIDRIKIPTLLAQGQSDTLFDLQESAATYRQLADRGVPVKLVWKEGGHSGGAASGEENLSGFNDHLAQVYRAWFDHWLADAGPTPALDFSWFRDWVPYTGSATPAYASAPSYPATAITQQLFLSGGAAMVPQRTEVTAGSGSFAVPSAGAPTSYSETSAVDQNRPVTDSPGTFAAFSTGPLLADFDLVGTPTVDLHVTAPTHAGTQAAGPAGQLVLFVKVYDVAPDGTTIVLPHRLIAPIRIADVTAPVHVELPGVVHRFPAGHTLRLVVAAGDTAYKGNTQTGPVSIDTSPSAPSTLTFPVAQAGAIHLEAVAPVVPESPLPALLPLGALLLAGGAVWRRRARPTT